jgi:SagB-type dehydrogenase family enzyme
MRLAVNRGDVVSRQGQVIDLPAPVQRGTISVEEALRSRRSVREYQNSALTAADVSQLLWAAQGETSRDGFRTAPSAGARYPLGVYVVVGAVEKVPDGVYAYEGDGHRLRAVRSGDHRRALGRAAARQMWLADAAVVLVFTAVFERTTSRYGERGRRYVNMEVGHAAQNVYLQATAMELGTTFVGAFHDHEVASLLPTPPEEQPLGLMPVGRSR